MTKRDAVATVLRRSYRQWVSAVVLVKAGGLLAWRTEVSRCRTELGMNVQQKTERTRTGCRSWYRYVGRAKTVTVRS